MYFASSRSSAPRQFALPVLLLALLIGTTRSGEAESYPLGPEDQLRLKIYEWRASRDTIFEWTALNDVFTVGADGMLSLPFAGGIMAEGLGTGALADAIADRLARNMGLGQPPDVAVEVVRFRPFYILGDVARPGEFPYRPGLNVLEAVSIAGGLPPQPDGLSRVGREIIGSRGDLDQLALTRVSLLARQARLRAEAANAETIRFPAVLSGASGAAAAMMEQERTVFHARREGFETQLRALEELRGFLDREFESLNKQLGFLDQRIESMRQELGTVSTLVDQGLAATPRRMELERSLLQLQSDRLATETSLLRARQDASRTELSILELRNNRATEVADDLREMEPKLGEIQSKMEVTVALLGEAETAELRLGGHTSRGRPIYKILRPAKDGKVDELVADEATEVRPGDTVKVELPPLAPERLMPGSTPTGSGAPLDTAPASGGEARPFDAKPADSALDGVRPPA